MAGACSRTEAFRFFLIVEPTGTHPSYHLLLLKSCENGYQEYSALVLHAVVWKVVRFLRY
jgi:hypothetical protein